ALRNRGPLVNPVNDYMCYSIFTMLCCCLPLGIAALIYSISVSLIQSLTFPAVQTSACSETQKKPETILLI
uniref:Uncharacterized protein n=1 Tax=Mola mola TaxID=94237 RepID=A0A3Q3W9T5_MOLML